MHSIEKTASEELWRYHNFRRNIAAEGWLPTTATLSSVDIIVEDSTGATCTAAMIESAKVFSDSKVQYLLKGGVYPQAYTVAIQVLSSDGQRFEDFLEVTITA